MISIPKGTKDVLPQDSYKWHYVENLAREVAQIYGLSEIRTPVFEHTELFLRGVGETTDVVNKEMYTFEDKGARSITLKPEGTAGVARSYIENSLFQGAQPVKMYYITPVFRYERPQAGRLREHHQFGVELYGASSPGIDAEVIALAKTIFNRLGVPDLELNINSIGCPQCRAGYNAALQEYYRQKSDRLCPTCRDRLTKNPLRILDCKEPDCIDVNKSAPVILDYLCNECGEHFSKLKGFLQLLNIPFRVNPRIVRGLDYYTKTVFEFVSTAIGSQGTVCGGGRYDGLVSSLGGKPAPGVGFGMGLERLLLLLETIGAEIPNTEILQAYVINADETAYATCYQVCAALRGAGISADVDHAGRGMKAQLKYADKLGAKYTVIIGGEEIAAGNMQVKNMANGNQVSVLLSEAIQLIKENR